ncbi:MAG: site-2 protease family protein [bacterium]|nr:site-2 protease family protein [bacterium]
MSAKIIEFVIMAVVLIISVSIHEAAHGWMAEKFGDPTARNLGRITLNPIPHIDIVGSIVVPLICYFAGGILFGWAKPVPINPYNLRDRKRANIMISIAGPVSNILLAVTGIVGLLLLKHLGIALATSLIVIIIKIFKFLVVINVILTVLNLLPIPPLDGSHILEEMLHGNALYHFQKIKPYGFMILLGILYLGVLRMIVNPIFSIIKYILQRG